MPDGSNLPRTRIADELPGIAAARRVRRRRLWLFAGIGLAALPVAATAFSQAPTLLVWNASASAPTGLYRVDHLAQLRRGDMVVARLPQPARSLAAARHYLPSNVPAVKRVTAVPGDIVCALRSEVRINGRHSASRLERDTSRRPMPWWTGCQRLATGEYFLLTNRARSFDGRYFGITHAGEIVGKATLLWKR